MIHLIKYIAFLLILFSLVNAFSQDEIPNDSLTTVKKSSSGIDTLVTMSSTDSVTFDVKQKIMRLRGESKLNYKSQKIQSEIIEISFDDAIMNAYGIKDSTGVIEGFPIFNDLGEEFAGEQIKFNFKTSKGVITMGETELSEGFYYGERIKKISETAFFVSDGKYTTCDAPHPHYYFGSPEMKVEAGNKVYLDPIILYVEDLPVFILPFGLFFPNTGGRQSGLIVPTFYFSQSRGVVLQDFGFYWASSDYWDTQLRVDFFSKGGYLLQNQSRFKYRDLITGNLELQYGKNKLQYDDPYNTNWSIRGDYSQTINPSEQINANFNFASGNFYQNTQTDNNLRITQNIDSRIGYNKVFQNNSNLSVSYTRFENIIDGSNSQSIPVRWNYPSFKPLNKIDFLPKWFKDSRFSYSLNALYSDAKNIQTDFVEFDDDSSYLDTSYVFTSQRRIEHRPQLSIAPKFGFFTFNPTFNFSANNYFRRVTRNFNPEDSTTYDETENGFFTEYNYSFSFGLTTTLYGIIDSKRKLFLLLDPAKLGIKAFRHTYRPSISFRYNPDLSSPDLDFYGEYFDERLNRDVQYSRFQLDGGGLASRNKALAINYSDQHVFEMKIPKKDSLNQDENYELLNVGFSTSYNFVADSLNLSDISMNFRTPAIEFLQFNGSASFTMYDEFYTNIIDPRTGRITTGFQKVNEFLYENGKGLMRMTNFSLNASTSFSSKGISLKSQFGEEKKESEEKESKLGQRFSIRQDIVEESHAFGDNIEGFTPFTIPWSASFSINYNYGMANQSQYSKTENLFLRARLSFTPTPTIQVGATAGIDLLTGELRTPNIDISKDLHCWQLSFNWVPTGFNRGFYLRFGIKASQLSDLKIEKEDNPLLR